MEVGTAAEYFDYLAGLSKYASLSRFLLTEMCFVQTKPRESSKKGVATPFLVVLRGIAKGENRNSPFAVFFLPPAAFSLPRKEKGAESSPRLRRGRADSDVRPYESVQTGRCAPRTPCADKLSPFR